MRVKVGNVWHESKPGQPIMVELSEEDKVNVKRMVRGENKYAEFHDNDPYYCDPADGMTRRMVWMTAKDKIKE